MEENADLCIFIKDLITFHGFGLIHLASVIMSIGFYIVIYNFIACLCMFISSVCSALMSV